MRTGRPLAAVSIAEPDRLQLVARTRRAKAGQSLDRTAPLLPLCVPDKSNAVHTIMRATEPSPCLPPSTPRAAT